MDNLDEVCRLCLGTEQPLSSVFDVAQLDRPFPEKITFFLGITVSKEDKLSTLVCASCIKTITQWNSYRDSCTKSQIKLQQWLEKQNKTITPIVRVKEEPLEYSEYTDDDIQSVPNDTINTNHVQEERMEVDGTDDQIPSRNVQSLPDESPNNIGVVDKEHHPMVQIKSEPIDVEEDETNVDIESVASETPRQLVINPLASANTSSERVMEADSTQKVVTKLYNRKKIRRRTHTHYRGTRLFKKKCMHCKIYLHSKWSFQQHMSRYHGKLGVGLPPREPPVLKQIQTDPIKSRVAQNVDSMKPVENNEINPEEEEYVKLIKTDPLTPIQKNIISQLKTFSCYLCSSHYSSRKGTLYHIRQHMADLKPFTCVACLTQFPDRSMYKLHSTASFECAMKIALVIPSLFEEVYFTCNMCLKSCSNRKELLEHLMVHAHKQQRQLNESLREPPMLKPITTSSPKKQSELHVPGKSISINEGPYMNGDPAHNHMCDLCGMIYKHIPNLTKHRDICLTLPEDIRTSYKCIHCNMTYLIYKKFVSHIFSDHKVAEITCCKCHATFANSDDYLTHHESHRNIKKNNLANPLTEEDNQRYQYQQQQLNASDSMPEDPLQFSRNAASASKKPFSCALCNDSFASKAELTEHRNLHLKVKIYSCVICRSMFSSSSNLEEHMKKHGIADPNEVAEGNMSHLNTSQGDYSQDESMNVSSMSAMSEPGPRHKPVTCRVCNKTFHNPANLKRHEKNLHFKQQRRWTCYECHRRFKTNEEYHIHLRITHGTHGPQQLKMHKQLQGKTDPVTGKAVMQCPKCPRTFTYQGNLIIHCQNVHKENHFERAKANATRSEPNVPRSEPTSHSCNICGKTFREQQALKTHRGWHLRVNYRLKNEKNTSLPNVSLQMSPEKVDRNVPEESSLSGPGYTMTIQPTQSVELTLPKPAKARKSFPNVQNKVQVEAIKSLQCQVCDDRFADVTELRTHLWNVHCARNKPDEVSVSELQCELCSSMFQDEDSLERHMKWHEQNPEDNNDDEIRSAASSNVSSSPQKFHCETCGKCYSNRKVFLRHKKLHKIHPSATMMNFQSLHPKRHYYCAICQKNFATEASLKRHKVSPCHQAAARSQMQSTPKKITTTALVHHPPPELVKMPSVKKEPGLDYTVQSQPVMQTLKKKPVTCHFCKTIFPNMSVLYQHKQLVHPSTSAAKFNANQCVPLVGAEGMVCCNLCGKQFPGIPNLKQHFTLKHKNKGAGAFPCFSPGCKLAFANLSSLRNHETTHSNTLYNCKLCMRHMFSRGAMIKHMLNMHKAVYQSGAEKSTLWNEINLANYTIKDVMSTSCPVCKVKYPNLRALKIHYFKFHDKTYS